MTTKDLLDCAHENTNYRRRVRSNGALYIATQCADCGGHGRGQARAYPFSVLKERDIQSLKAFDEDAFKAREDAVWTAQRIQHAQGAEERRAKRAAYYETPQWRSIRARVLRRAGGLCEGCGIAEPTQAHHLTYEHFGEEFLFELLALCEPCHIRVHAEHKAREQELIELGGEWFDQ